MPDIQGTGEKRSPGAALPSWDYGAPGRPRALRLLYRWCAVSPRLDPATKVATM